MQNIGFYKDRADVEFILINNGSEDNTVTIIEMQRGRTNNIAVITNEENGGFSVACNQGAAVAKGDILLFLNNDVLIFGDYVSQLQRVVDDEVIAGPELNTYDTGWNLFGQTLVQYIAGWCLALTKATYTELGGFDERYSPCDYEDMDLCYAARLAGKLLVYLPLPIRHQFGGSSLSNRLEITERNRIKFAEKWGL